MWTTGPPVISLNWLFPPPVSSLPSGRYCSLTRQSKPPRVFGCPKNVKVKLIPSFSSLWDLRPLRQWIRAMSRRKDKKRVPYCDVRAVSHSRKVFHHLLMKLSDTMKERRRSRLSLDSGMIVVIFIRWVATVLNITCAHQSYSSGWSLSYSSGRHWHWTWL